MLRLMIRHLSAIFVSSPQCYARILFASLYGPVLRINQLDFIHRELQLQ